MVNAQIYEKISAGWTQDNIAFVINSPKKQATFDLAWYIRDKLS